jgi:type IV pilus assembly protein PilA
MPKRHTHGFSLLELIIVVAVILVLAAIAIPSLLRSKMTTNEASAVGSQRALTSACTAYSTTWGQGFPVKLANLGPGSPATSAAADLIDSVLAGGKKSGYTLVYVSGAPNNGKILSYTINANPIIVKQTGTRYFFTDQSGVIRYNFGSAANAASKPLS